MYSTSIKDLERRPNMQLQAGTKETLMVSRKIDSGYVLTNGTREVLLHLNETVGTPEVDEEVQVFLYNDKKGQLIATMSIPEADLETYDWVEVVEVVKGLGVFVNIGIEKEILVSKDDLPLLEAVWPEPGDELLVRLDTDKKGRLLAIPTTETILEGGWEKAPETVLKQPISGRVYRSTKVGSFVMTEEGYKGFIHYLERKREPRLGEWINGRVIDVKDDGTVNISLRPVKEEALDEDATIILEYLESNGGVMSFNDKSDPDEIRNTFNISKAAFKRALGRLMKDRKVQQKDGQTSLTEEN